MNLAIEADSAVFFNQHHVLIPTAPSYYAGLLAPTMYRDFSLPYKDDCNFGNAAGYVGMRTYVMRAKYYQMVLSDTSGSNHKDWNAPIPNCSYDLLKM